MNVEFGDILAGETGRAGKKQDESLIDDIAGGVQASVEFTFEVEGASKPSCVAEVVFRNYV